MAVKVLELHHHGIRVGPSPEEVAKARKFYGDVLGLHRVLTGLDRDSIEMREVSPMGGLLPQDERQAALREEQADATRPA